jgi:hypothetical protein
MHRDSLLEALLQIAIPLAADLTPCPAQLFPAARGDPLILLLDERLDLGDDRLAP